MLGDSSDAVLFDQVRPQDVQQGWGGSSVFRSFWNGVCKKQQKVCLDFRYVILRKLIWVVMLMMRVQHWHEMTFIWPPVGVSKDSAPFITHPGPTRTREQILWKEVGSTGEDSE